jgi:hypothetical protein
MVLIISLHLGYWRERLTNELGCLLVPMLIEELDHRRNHREIEEKEESDSGVLVVSQHL